MKDMMTLPQHDLTTLVQKHMHSVASNSFGAQYPTRKKKGGASKIASGSRISMRIFTKKSQY
jgi:hypothetical protein